MNFKKNFLPPTMSPEPKRKPRTYPPAPYPRTKPKKISPADVPATSARDSLIQTRCNLTLSDWMMVFAFVDSHPDVTQPEIVRHFGSLAKGALIFDQSTLSRKLKMRTKLEQRAQSNPSALSSKRPRVVTCPDVERAFVLWVDHMEEKGEVVSGPMLRAKRKRFEDVFEVWTGTPFHHYPLWRRNLGLKLFSR